MDRLSSHPQEHPRNLGQVRLKSGVPSFDAGEFFKTSPVIRLLVDYLLNGMAISRSNYLKLEIVLRTNVHLFREAKFRQGIWRPFVCRQMTGVVSSTTKGYLASHLINACGMDQHQDISAQTVFKIGDFPVPRDFEATRHHTELLLAA